MEFSLILNTLSSYLSNDRHLFISLAGMCVLVCYFLTVWWAVGREPEKGTIIPLFEPLDNMSPAVIRYLWKMGYDGRSLGAAIISMAVKGYLIISEQVCTARTGQSFILEKKDNGDLTSLSKDERKLAKIFFPPGEETIDLGRLNDSRIWKASTALRDHLFWQYNRTFFTSNILYWVPGLVILALTFIAIATNGGILIIITTSILLWLVFWWRLTFRSWKQRSFLLAGISLLIALCSNIALLFLIVVLIMTYSKSASTVPITSLLFTTLVLIISVLASIRFYLLLQASTRLGRRILDRIEGFRNYLITAEENQLKTMYPDNSLPKQYHPNLPYALALDIHLPWLQRFSAAFPFESEWIPLGPDEGE